MIQKLLTKELFRNIATGLIIASCFSSFLYLSHYQIEIKLLNTLSSLCAFYMLLHASKKSILFAGFFIGIFWFYWISYSFKYYDVAYIAPFIVFGFGIIYALFFGLLTLTDKPYLRAIILFGLSFFEPLHFNWMQLSLPFLITYLGVEKWQFFIILLALGLDGIFKKKYYKHLPLLLLIFSTDIQSHQNKVPPLKIDLIHTTI